MTIFWIKTFAFSVMALTLIDWLLRRWYFPYRQRKQSLHWLDTREKQRCHHIFQQLFSKVMANSISFVDRGIIRETGDNFTYGEVEFIAIGKMLEHIPEKRNTTFIDLGSGTGKAVIAAALLHPTMRCLGVELLPGLHKKSQHIRSDLQRLQPSIPDNSVQFIHANLFEYDFTHADILFINATCFGEDIIDHIRSQIPLLKPGSHIIITDTTLNVTGIECVASEVLVMSWGKAYCNIYVVVGG